MSYRYTIAPSRINDAFNLTQLHNVSVNIASNNDIIVPGGGLDPGAVIMTHADTVVSFGTHDLATALANVTLSTGLSCTSGATFYFQKRADAGTFLSSTNNQKIASAAGFLMLNGISAAQDGPADGSFTYYPFSSDGLTQPLAYTDSVSIVTSPAFVSKFYFGKVKLGSSFLNGVVSLNYSNGMGFRYHPQDGHVYRTNGSIYSRTPTITLTVHSLQEVMTNIAPDFGNDAGTNLKLFLRKGASGSTRVADGTAEHISINFATCAWNVVSADGANSDDVGIQLQATCIGTPTLSTATAIS